MTVLTETPRVYQWIHAQVNALAPGGAHKGVAPDLTPTPFIVYTLISGLAVSGVAGVRLWQNGLYLVEVLGPDTDYAAIVACADAVANALELTHGNTSDATIMRSVLDEDIERSEIVDGAPWSHVGARWRIYTRKT